MRLRRPKLLTASVLVPVPVLRPRGRHYAMRLGRYSQTRYGRRAFSRQAERRVWRPGAGRWRGRYHAAGLRRRRR